MQEQIVEQVSFDVSRVDGRVIKKIAQRAVAALSFDCEFVVDVQHVQMDVAAVHANGCPLRLNELLEADRFNFAHDILGIARHLDRHTGRLGNHFLPRFAVQESR